MGYSPGGCKESDTTEDASLASLANLVPSSHVKFPLLSFVVVVHLLSHVSLLPHGLQHSRFPCAPLSPGVCLDSCPLSR